MTELVQASSAAGRPRRATATAARDDLGVDGGYRAEVSEGVMSAVARHVQVGSQSEVLPLPEPLAVRIPDDLVR